MEQGAPAGRWEQLLELRPYDHLHLDDVMDASPTPGSIEWLPVIEEVIEFLRQHDGLWAVTLPLGCSDSGPDESLTWEGAWALADARELREPPSVHALLTTEPSTTWRGQVQSVERARPDGVVETVSVRRSDADAAENDPWIVSVHYKIGSRAPAA